MNARDKMPFEVTPVFYKLQRYEAAHVVPAAAPATAAPPAPAPAASQQPAAGHDDGQPAGPPAVGNASAQPQGQQTTATAQSPQ
jgi:hypothetical protein